MSDEPSPDPESTPKRWDDQCRCGHLRGDHAYATWDCSRCECEQWQAGTTDAAIVAAARAWGAARAERQAASDAWMAGGADYADLFPLAETFADACKALVAALGKTD